MSAHRAASGALRARCAGPWARAGVPHRPPGAAGSRPPLPPAPGFPALLPLPPGPGRFAPSARGCGCRRGWAWPRPARRWPLVVPRRVDLPPVARPPGS
eukprot:14812015-Heterocapsa_arctica.AAC.1